MNIATALPAPNLAAANIDLTAGLLQNSGIGINFAAVFADAAGLGAEPAGEKQADSDLDLELAMPMMAAQVAMLPLVQPDPQAETKLPAIEKSVLPVVQTVSGISAVIKTPTLEKVNNVPGAAMSAAIGAATVAATVEAANPEKQPVQQTSQSKQNQAVEPFAASLKTAEALPAQAPVKTAANAVTAATAAVSESAAATTAAAPATAAVEFAAAAAVPSITNPTPAASAMPAKPAKSEQPSEVPVISRSAVNVAVSEPEIAIEVKADETSAQSKQSDSKNEEKPAKASAPAWINTWESVKPASYSNTASNAVLSASVVTDAQAADASNVVRQIVDQAEITWQNGDQVIEIKLSPDSFGEVQIRLTKGEDGITAQIRTDNSQTSDLLNTQITQLQDSLKSKGLTFTDINVQFFTAGSDLASRQQSQSGQTDRQQSQTRRPGNRSTRAAGISATESAAASAGTTWTRAGKIDYMA